MPSKSAPSTEPETLGPADVAGLTTPPNRQVFGGPTKAKSPAIDKSLNPLVGYLDGGPDAISLVRAMGAVWPQTVAEPQAIEALRRLIALDVRFKLSLVNGADFVDLAYRATCVCGDPTKEGIKHRTDGPCHYIEPVDASAAPVGDAPPADDEPPGPIPMSEEESDAIGDVTSVPTLGERLAAAEANGQPPIESTLAQPISSTIASAAPEAAIPLTEQEKHDQLFAAMQKHQKQSTELAAEFFDLKRTELGQDSALKQTRETLKELQKTMASHMAAVPTLETIAQRTIAFDTQCETGPGDQPQAEGGEASAWPYHVPPEHVINVSDLRHGDDQEEVSIDNLIARILLEIPPSEKPMQIKEHVVTVKGSDYLPRQASPDCTRVFLQPVVSRDTYQQVYEEKYGRALKDFDQTNEAKELRQTGGDDCGRPVKVGRNACVMGPESEGLVIVAAAPADAPAEAAARDEATFG